MATVNDEFKPIPTARFYFEVEGLTEKLVKKVSGIKSEGKTKGHEKPLASTKAGKTLWQTTSSGFENNPNLTIETYLCEGDQDWYNWLKSTMPGSEGGDGKWSSARKDGSLVGYDSEDKEIIRWNIFAMWIKSYEVSTEFNAESEDLATETFEIICERINRTDTRQ